MKGGENPEFRPIFKIFFSKIDRNNYSWSGTIFNPLRSLRAIRGHLRSSQVNFTEPILRISLSCWPEFGQCSGNWNKISVFLRKFKIILVCLIEIESLNKNFKMIIVSLGKT